MPGVPIHVLQSILNKNAVTSDQLARPVSRCPLSPPDKLRTPLPAQADVAFPGGKKTKANSGAPLKTVASKAGYKAAYGCEEGKCGTCEHKASFGSAV